MAAFANIVAVSAIKLPRGERHNERRRVRAAVDHSRRLNANRGPVKQPLTEVRGFILRSKQDLAKFPEHSGALHESNSSRPNVFPCRATPVSGSCQARQHPLPYFDDGPACAREPPISGRMPPCVDGAKRCIQHRSAIPPATEVAGFLAESSMNSSWSWRGHRADFNFTSVVRGCTRAPL